ncbi:4Fe-4S binding protein [Robiginitalea sp. M366]|uniref:4Fe-4S binding protein n=1 Tax=Robiginitalea aestuariiviva TaxID=3036903 RepID=UPI00240D2530|nr:4Fe-4S dicluster domain-containing protein [Robiginitalea aestuariiviva]MDG1571849.1 4Fe-4S binding protein [Robiginitalea aestuariiviva]
MNPSLSLAGGPPSALNRIQRLSLFLGFAGLFILLLATFGIGFPKPGLWLALALFLILGGVLGYSLGAYSGHPAGIRNNGVWFKSLSARGIWAWGLGILLTGFYVVLYFYPQYLGLVQDGPNRGLIALFDPLSRALSGNPASQWFVYGALYTLAILAFGAKFIWKYRHNRYQLLRTLSVMFFQLAFAFLIPEIMARLNGDLPYYDLKNIWPLNYYNFERYRVNAFIGEGNLGLAMLLFGVASTLVITPVLTYFYGKRWYCSWVCGCGGLAETAGDPFRHLSDKSTFAWRVERWVIYSVLVFVVLMTTAVVYSYLGPDHSRYWLSRGELLVGVGVLLTLVFAWVMLFRRKELQKDARYGAIAYFTIILALIGFHYLSDTQHVFLFRSETLRKTYSLLIGSIFSGVIGTGFYPIFGSRVWCRFGCPMAAILGLQQRLLSRFRITTNGGQCISCGNCSAYCEMGIDVRAYAQKGRNIVRASCVGCGICSAVCPRGVLRLENGPLQNRINHRDMLLGAEVDLMDFVGEEK